MKTLPDSLSGWQLTWTPPLSTDGWTRTYVFFESLTADQAKALVNGADLPSGGLGSPYLILPAGALSLDIPTRYLTDSSNACMTKGCRGMAAPTTREFWYTVWAQYGSGDVGEPIRFRLFLGDEYIPELPAIRRDIGWDTAQFAWDSTFDQVSRFVPHQFGKLSQIRWKLWRGLYQVDSSLVRLQSGASSIGHAQSTALPEHHQPGDVSDWSDSLTDSASINTPLTRLSLHGLKPFQTYTLVITYVDRFGNRSPSTPQTFSTRDSLPPVGVTGISALPASPTLVNVNFQAATDSFSSAAIALRDAFPNYHIRWIHAILNGKRVDSLDLPNDSSFAKGQENASGNWTWSNNRWTWSWPSMQPGSTDSVYFLVTDLSGNLQTEAPEKYEIKMYVDASVANLGCPAGYTPVGAGRTFRRSGDTIQVPSVCMETYPHSDATLKPIISVTFEQAQAACAADGARLCSEWEWQHACEGNGDSTALLYGVASLTGTGDMSTLLKDRCGLFSGDSSWLLARDPRCMSPWGIHNMAGPVFEIVDSLYSTLDPKFTGVRILKGGPWEAAENYNPAPTAACRYRNYPAYSDSINDTVQFAGNKIPRPRADFQRGFGFRCCRPATALSGRRIFLP
jgi:Sulfatase-modifying factor enzyme 1